jgi:hypothetical protein
MNTPTKRLEESLLRTPKNAHGITYAKLNLSDENYLLSGTPEMKSNKRDFVKSLEFDDEITIKEGLKGFKS